MRGLFIFILCFLISLPTYAANSVCEQVARTEKLVNLRYIYGTLGFDASKSEQEISALCTDNAAGCFLSQNGVGTWSVTDKIVKSGNQNCVVPEINIEYDFSGARIYIMRDGDACRTRAVLRHELQHFTIWKTTREWFLKDLKQSLQQAAARLAVLCLPEKRCATDGMTYLSAVVQKVEQRWKNVERRNQDLLDSVDHSASQQVNYPVCAPYSLKVGLF